MMSNRSNQQGFFHVVLVVVAVGVLLVALAFLGYSAWRNKSSDNTSDTSPKTSSVQKTSDEIWSDQDITFHYPSHLHVDTSMSTRANGCVPFETSDIMYENDTRSSGVVTSGYAIDYCRSRFASAEDAESMLYSVSSHDESVTSKSGIKFHIKNLDQQIDKDKVGNRVQANAVDPDDPLVVFTFELHVDAKADGWDTGGADIRSMIAGTQLN